MAQGRKTSEEDGDVAEKGRRGRSPNYPGLNLEEAIQRTKTLYDHEGKNAAHMDVVLGHWGYKPKSGLGLVICAGLKQYGLIKDEGSGESRKAVISSLGLDIILDKQEDSTQRLQAIKKAALLPSSFRDVCGNYSGALPSDQTLRFYLVRERGYTNRGASDFISHFRHTIEFAKLSESDMLSASNGDNGGSEIKPPKPSEGQTMTPQTAILPQGEQQIGASIPVAPDCSISITADGQVTQGAIDNLVKYLQLFKGSFPKTTPDLQPGPDDNEKE